MFHGYGNPAFENIGKRIRPGNNEISRIDICNRKIKLRFSVNWFAAEVTIAARLTRFVSSDRIVDRPCGRSLIGRRGENTEREKERKAEQ